MYLSEMRHRRFHKRGDDDGSQNDQNQVTQKPKEKNTDYNQSSSDHGPSGNGERRVVTLFNHLNMIPQILLF